MNVNGRHLPDLDDLEITAELPLLTGVVAPQADPLIRTDKWPQLQLADVPDPSTGPRLEDDLRALGASLQDLQRQLIERGERVARLEADLDLAQASHRGSSDQASALQEQLAGANMALSVSRARIQELEAAVGGRDQQLQAALAREGELRQGLARQGQETDLALRQRESQAHAEMTRLQGTAAQLRSDLDAARAGSAAQLEALQSLEGRRGIFDSQLRGLDQQVLARDQQLESRAQRIAALEADLAARRDAEHAVQQRQSLEAAEAHRLLEQAHDQLRATHDATLDQLNQLVEQSREQLASRDATISELTLTNTELQARMDEAHQWLKERDSRMQRLESEAMHSHALVDNIQRSIRQLEPATAAAAPHEAPKVTGTHMLVRIEDGREIAQVLGQRTTIGRTPDNDLQIDAAYISRHHAVILCSDAHVVIEDLGSTNGVYVGGQRVDRHLLKAGDTVIIGKQSFTYTVRTPM